MLRETNPSVAGMRQPGRPEVSGRRDAAEREHLHWGLSMAAARRRTTRAAKSPYLQVDSRGLYIGKCEKMLVDSMIRTGPSGQEMSFDLIVPSGGCNPQWGAGSG